MKRRPGIVAFAFGIPSGILPNKRIALIASMKARELDAPVFTQRDIHPVLGRVKYIPENPGKPPPTLRMAREAIKWAIQREINELWVVAAQPHLPRAIRDLKYAISKSGVKIELMICGEIYDYGEASWFTLDSNQERTQSLENWTKRERILMFMPMWLYKLIAN